MRSILSAFPVPEVHFQCLLETETFNFFSYLLIFFMRLVDLLISPFWGILNM